MKAIVKIFTNPETGKFEQTRTYPTIDLSQQFLVVGISYGDPKKVDILKFNYQTCDKAEKDIKSRQVGRGNVSDKELAEFIMNIRTVGKGESLHKEYKGQSVDKFYAKYCNNSREVQETMDYYKDKLN